jgi:hypothetical protein
VLARDIEAAAELRVLVEQAAQGACDFVRRAVNNLHDPYWRAR